MICGDWATDSRHFLSNGARQYNDKKITRSCASVNIDIQYFLSNGTRQYNDENHTLMRVSEYRHTDISYDASHI